MNATNSAAKSDLVASADEKTVKRAQWESFSFELEAPGMVLVTNDSYDDDGHSYLVNVWTDVPVACECKAFQYQEGPCKHMIAVAIREPVLIAAQRRQQPTPIPDGGQTDNTCKNGQTGCCSPNGDDLPCFDCYQDSH